MSTVDNSSLSEIQSYQVSNKYVRRKKIHAVLISMILSLFCVLAVFLLWEKFELMALFAAIVLGYHLPGVISSTVALIRLGKDSFPTISIDAENEVMRVSHDNQAVSVLFADFKKLRIQYRGRNIESIIAATTSRGKIRIEGYEDIENIASIFRNLVPNKNVEVSRWFHN